MIVLLKFPAFEGAAAGVGDISMGFAQIQANPAEISFSANATADWPRQNAETSAYYTTR
jgi:hypothetical protein